MKPSLNRAFWRELFIALVWSALVSAITILFAIANIAAPSWINWAVMIAAYFLLFNLPVKPASNLAMKKRSAYTAMIIIITGIALMAGLFFFVFP